MRSFENCLKGNDYDGLRLFDKGDLHNHIARGGNIIEFIKYFKLSNIKKPDKFSSFEEMEQWYQHNIGNYFDESTYELRIKWTLKQLVSEGIRIAVLTYGFQELKMFDSIYEFIELQNKMFLKYAPQVRIIPELGINSSYCIEDIEEKAKLIFESGFFKSIDIHGKEIETPEKYVNLYRLAKEYGLKLRAHVGEFGSPELINRAIDILNLEEINHGNRSVESIDLMRKIKRKGIRLNLCPESNIQLNLYSNLKQHPIRTLFDFGICVTVNTDDMLIFDKGINQLYIELYNERIFNEFELEEIRKNSLWF